MRREELIFSLLENLFPCEIGKKKASQKINFSDFLLIHGKPAQDRATRASE